MVLKYIHLTCSNKISRRDKNRAWRLIKTPRGPSGWPRGLIERPRGLMEKLIAKIEELKAKFTEGAAEAPETISYGDHASQYYRVHRPSVPEPWWAVLIIHGGFWREKYNISNAAIETIAPALARRGFCAVEVEYRRVGNEGGWPESCDDVDAALKHCIEHVAGLSERRIVLLGHSAGGHAALMCAANAQTAPRLVVAIAPVGRPPRWLNIGRAPNIIGAKRTKRCCRVKCTRANLHIIGLQDNRALLCPMAL